MPVSAADDFDEPPAKCCKYCDDDSAEREVWNIQIDSDILDTIKDKFPAWFSPVASTSKHTPFEAFGDFPGLIAMAHHQGLPSLSELNDDVLSSGSGSSESRQSPPKAIVDSSPLTMDKNRESLKVKLMVRRSVNQLVEQGIMPPLKTSPAIHEQKKLLERAKTGDLLKAKIQQRPDRQELERRHILETHESHIDPSLADKYRMLEKAILVDQLNSKISHRPGPLELIEKNILHADEPIERIVKNGLVTFKTTLEDEELQASSNFVPLEDDSTQSSEGDAQVQQQQIQIRQLVQPVPQKIPQVHHQVIKTEPEEQLYHHIVNANMLDATSAGIINIQVALPTHEIREIQAPIINFFQNLQNQQNQINLQNAQQNVQNVQIVPPPPPLPIKTETITYHVKQISQPIVQSQQIHKVEPQNPSFIPIIEQKHRIDQNMQQNVHSPGSVSSSMSPASSIASPGPILPTKNSIATFLQNNQKYSAPGKDRNRKKSKSKPMSKLRAIKFHEYKGPPNSKGGGSSSSSGSSGNCSKKTGETNYELILQQQCLLEYLEGIYKPPHQTQSKMKVEMCEEPVQQHQHTMKFHDSSALSEKHNIVMNRLPASNTVQKAQVTIFPSSAASTSNSNSNNVTASTVVTTTITDIVKLNKMKVSDLKAQLKKLNLPVSGPKPLLVERLKPFLPFETVTSSVAPTPNIVTPVIANIEEETISSNNSHNSNISHDLDNFNSSLHSQQSQHSVSSESDVDYMEVQNSPAPPTHYMQMPSNLSNISNISSVSNISNISNISVTEEDIVREQQRKIEELQRQLQQSQLELEQMKQHQLPESENGSPTNMQEIQDIQDDEEPEPLQFTQSAAKLENQTIFSPTPTNFLPPKDTKSFLIYENNQFQLNNLGNLNNLNNQTTMFLGQEEKSAEPTVSNNIVINVASPPMVEKAPSQSPKLQRIESPPRYEDAAKEKKLMMSHEIQDMNDVLEILIKNGELDERTIESRTPNYSHLMIDPNVMFDSSSSPLIDPPDNSLLTYPDEYSILSPMQPMQEDHHIDHNGETIDKLLGQAQNNIPLNSMHLPSNTKYQPMLQENVREPPSHNLTDFTDIDYMEFPMEIEEPQKEDHCDSSSNSLNNCYSENDLLDRFTNTVKSPSMHRSGMDENHQQLLLNSFIESLNNNNNPICAGNPYLTSNIYSQKSMLGKEHILVNDPSNITPMDFDNILSFDLQANDSFNEYMNNNPLNNDDYRMGNGDTIMNCEVDNLLCNI